MNRWASQEDLAQMTESDKRCISLHLKEIQVYFPNFRMELIEALFKALNQEKHDRTNLNSRNRRYFFIA